MTEARVRKQLVQSCSKPIESDAVTTGACIKYCREQSDWVD